jgi:glycerophosphoryl diester phosphodiesterase
MQYGPQHRLSLQWLVDRPIAHRGLHVPIRGIIENTPTAFAAALSRGFAIECDVQMTSDGEAIVFHDDEVDRLMQGRGELRTFTARQLQTLRFRQTRDRMQTLGELLDQVAGAVPLVIEIKSRWDGDMALVSRVLQVVASYQGPFCLMSFDPDILEMLYANAPDVVRGIVADRAVDPYYDSLPLERRIELRRFTHVSRTMPHFISYYWQDLPFEPITQAREAGLPIITWTIRSRTEAAAALRYSDQITFEGFLP